MKLGEAMYAAQQEEASGGPDGPDAGAGGGDDGVVDADFEEVEDSDDQQKRSA